MLRIANLLKRPSQHINDTGDVLSPYIAQRPRMAGVFAMIATLGLIAFHQIIRPSLAVTIVHGAGFPLYFPSSIPSGYVYNRHSVKLENHIVFYDLQSKNDTIIVSEQPEPQHMPNIYSLPGYTKVSISDGSAVVGFNDIGPTAIILNTTTLLSISGSKDIHLSTITAIVKSMRLMPS